MLQAGHTFAQGYIQFSKQEGSPGIGSDIYPIRIVNDEAYVIKQEYAPINYIHTVATKYSSTGAVIYTTDLGTEPYGGYYYSMSVVNGEVYLLGTSLIDPIYFFGLANKIVLIKLAANGNMTYKKIIGGSAYLYYIFPEKIIGNEMILSGSLYWNNDFPVTMPGVVTGGNFLTKINLADGEITRSMFIPSSDKAPVFEDNFIYTASTNYGAGLPTTIGNSAPPNTSGGIYIQKLNATDFSTIYSRYISPATSTALGSAMAHNGELYITGTTTATDFTVTNNSVLSAAGRDGFYTKLNVDGTIAFSSYIAVPGYQTFVDSVKTSNGNIYLAGSIYESASNTGRFVCRLNPNGSMAWIRKFMKANDPYVIIQQKFEVIGDDLYLAGVGVNPDYTVTNGSHYAGSTTAYFTHLNAAGNFVFSTFLNAIDANYSEPLRMTIDSNRIFIAGNTQSINFPATDSSTIKGARDYFITIFKPGGDVIMNSYIGGNGEEFVSEILPENGHLYITGETKSQNYPVTDNILLQHGNWDAFLTKISFCPNNYDLSNDTLFPKIQTVCKFGLADTIQGKLLNISANGLPILYLNSNPTTQHPPVQAHYQWQSASALTGPWTNIPGATLKDYRPIVGSVTQYFRRNAFASSDCNAAFIHTSDTVVVQMNLSNAPTLDAGNNLATCPSSVITIGGNPTVSGGTPPYSYQWDMGLPSIANPDVSPANNTAYTLIVTDGAGCKQIAQATVLVYKANAGINKSTCGGTPVKIGSPPIAGLPGVSYLWQPATGLNNTNIAQPFANPTIQTVYDLTLTLPKTGGGTCNTYDTVIVTPVAAPVTANFAGPDKVICLPGTASVGTVAEPGFTYSWNPTTYLRNINESQATYVANEDYMPIPNPAPVFLSAYKNGCTFSDEVTVATIESRAGYHSCDDEVTIVGLPDRTPNISETYSWLKISGLSNFTGSTNLPQVPVTPFVGNSSVYELTVSYNTQSCISRTDTLACCYVAITLNPPVTCPGLSVYDGPLNLFAVSNIQDAVYTWSPQEGLSAYTGNPVQLTDTIVRTYTVTVTSPTDSSIHCIGIITTDREEPEPLVFVARDTTTCAGEPVTIGPPPVNGLGYYWDGIGLSDPFEPNPIVTIDTTSQYIVTVYSNSCSLTDTVTVYVKNAPADAGGDWIVCSNALLTLGTPQLSNTSYLWEPSSAPWQNGTSQFSAQPQIIAAADATYILTTTSEGCVSIDTVNISVNNSPVIPDTPDTTICPGAGVLLGSPSLTGVTYQWSPSTGLDDPTLAQPFANPSGNTTYTLIATFPGSCSVASTDLVTVTVNNPAFDIPDIHFCPGGGPIDLGTYAPAGMNYYYWSPTDLVSSYTIANPTTIDPLPAGTNLLHLSIRNPAGCYYTDDFSLIPSTEIPFAGLDRTACKGHPVFIGSVLNTTGPSFSYNWSPSTFLDDPASPHPVFNSSSVGTFQYVLTKTDNTIPCSVNDTINIAVVDIFPALDAPTVCRNSCVQIENNPVAGITYSWYPANGLSDSSVSNPIACIDTVASTYTLTVSDQTGCTISGSLVIGVNAVPGVQVSIPVITACAGDNNVMFNPSVPAGSYSYLWSPDNGTLSDVNIQNPIIQIANPGTLHYSLQITDNTTGCSNTIPAMVMINNCPQNAEAGNFVWLDNNENGIQDIGEPGVSGAVVRLFNNTGFNIATSVTDASGNYNLNDIPPGNDYYIIFQKPAGYEFTVQNIGGSSALNNSKADVNGRTGNFDLVTADNISNMDAGIKPAQIVPVTLLNFTARLQNNGAVLLNWKTTAEIDNHYFDVERSNNGISYTAIARVDGYGTTSLPHNYTLYDPAPLNGFNYYRLKQVDFDGHFTNSNIEVVELKSRDIVTAWYNQNNHSIQLLFGKNQNNLEIKLYASNGQLIKSVNPANNIITYNLNLPILSTGIYMLQLTSDKTRYSKKIFINN